MTPYTTTEVLSLLASVEDISDLIAINDYMLDNLDAYPIGERLMILIEVNSQLNYFKNNIE